VEFVDTRNNKRGGTKNLVPLFISWEPLTEPERSLHHFEANCHETDDECDGDQCVQSTSLGEDEIDDRTMAVQRIDAANARIGDQWPGAVIVHP
jgi:hypothetical protein